MIMITGGAYQGKKDFVKAHYNCDILNGENCDYESVFTAKCVSNYHQLVKRLIGNGQNAVSYTERVCRENTDLIVIINEVGSGIVPLEKSDRLWREQVGMAGSLIAKNSDMVVRLICGIPIVIKGEL